MYSAQHRFWHMGFHIATLHRLMFGLRAGGTYSGVPIKRIVTERKSSCRLLTSKPSAVAAQCTPACVVMLRYINPPHCPLDKSSWSLNIVGVRGVDPHLPMQLKICLKLSPNFSVPRGLVPGPPLVPKC